MLRKSSLDGSLSPELRHVFSCTGRHMRPLDQQQMAQLRIALQDTLLAAERLTTPFITCLSEHGWKMERLAVEAEKKRASW